MPTTAPALLTPLDLRGVTARNRLWVSPMCQYSVEKRDGVPVDWHLVHLGSLAAGGAGVVFTEATAVTPDGRISPWDTGIWNDAQEAAWTRIAAFVAARGALPAIQLAHAGRKASTAQPWAGGGAVAPEDGGWRTVAPSAVAADPLPMPLELSEARIGELVTAFADAAERAVRAGFRILELHGAHGYLIHQFLSPLSNTRTDGYGGDLAGRSRFLLETVAAIRSRVGEEPPLVVRLSATDWAGEAGWGLEESVAVARLLRDAGVDLIDVSSGGLVRGVEIPVGPGYQVGFAREIRERAGIPVGAVGMITDSAQAEGILAEGSADAILAAREFLRDPHFPLRAARELGATGDGLWPDQYLRARWAEPSPAIR